MGCKGSIWPGFRSEFEPGQGLNTGPNWPSHPRCHIIPASGGSPLRREPSTHHDRSVRPSDHLPAGIGDRPLRPALRLLHVGGHDLPAQARASHAGGTRPAVRGVHPAGHDEDPHHRRRAAGAARRDAAVRRAGAAARPRAEGADRHHQRLATGQACRGAGGRRREADQRVAGYARSAAVHRRSPAGARSSRRWTASSPPRRPGWR